MNIFVLDEDPVRSAIYQCDKHIIKLIIESAQILCSVFQLKGIDTPYKLSKANLNKRIVKWVNESLNNYIWLYRHFHAQCQEYTRRYGKTHLTEKKMWMKFHPAETGLKAKGLTPFVQYMPEKYQSEDAVKSYREYFIQEKSYFAVWKDGKIPWWFKRSTSLNTPAFHS